MVIGIPKEIKPEEYRVAITPHGVRELVSEGHTVLCEPSLGEGSGFIDAGYEAAGARMVTKSRIFADAGLVLKVKEPLPAEFDLLRHGLAIFTYLHLAPNRPLLDALLMHKVTAFAYETLERDGGLPLLLPMSEIAGRIAPLVGAYFLQRPQGGRGVLPTGAPGVAPANMLVLGAGVVGTNSARVGLGLGMDVTVLNRGMEKLRLMERELGGRAKTRIASAGAIEECLPEADLVVGAVLVSGERAPVLVTRKMLDSMRPGAVIVDVSIDQGGCFETSRPTTHDKPVYEEGGVIHYCVANMPGAYPRTSTIALTEATLPYVKRLAGRGIDAVRSDQELRSALNVYDGMISHSGLAESTGLPYTGL